MLSILNAIAIVSIIASSHTPCVHQVGCFRYNCQDYTRDAMLLLRQNGYDAWAAYGIKTGIGLHNWIGVTIDGTTYHIEPQTGSLVYPSRRGSLTGDIGPYEFSRRGVVRGVW